MFMNTPAAAAVATVLGTRWGNQAANRAGRTEAEQAMQASNRAAKTETVSPRKNPVTEAAGTVWAERRAGMRAAEEAMRASNRAPKTEAVSSRVGEAVSSMVRGSFAARMGRRGPWEWEYRWAVPGGGEYVLRPEGLRFVVREGDAARVGLRSAGKGLRGQERTKDDGTRSSWKMLAIVPSHASPLTYPL